MWLFAKLASSICHAQAAFPAKDLILKGIYGERRAESNLYCLLGGGACQPPEDSGAADSFIRDWMAAHPNALATPISTERMSFFLPDAPIRREIYVWIQDGPNSLATALVREGFYPASMFADMLERDRKIHDAAKAISGAPEQKSRSRPIGETHRELPRRLVPDGEYAVLMKEVAEAAGNRAWSEDTTRNTETLSLAARMSRQSFSVRQMYANGVRAHRIGDADVYCLLGDAAFLLDWPIPPIVSGEYKFVSRWLHQHPAAVVTPISVRSHKRMQQGPPTHSTYVWVEDGGQSLNVELIREGFYKADVLRDAATKDDRGTVQRPNDDPAMDAEFPELENETDESEPLRLVSERDYSARIDRAKNAEQEAQRHKRGLWSDAVMGRWTPPSDAKLIKRYRKSKQSFSRVVDLVGSDPRLIGVNWHPESWTEALRAGVSSTSVHDYVRILKKLGVNQDLTGVSGIGKVCLITTDIVVGLFDTGVIKGYVWSPTDPSPLTDDLEHQTSDSSPPASNAPITYRHVDGQWYLFELVH